jgi:hypothetical protein
MKKTIYYFLLILPLWSFSCGSSEDNVGTLTLHFIPKYGDNTLVMQEKVTTNYGYGITFQRVAFFTKVEDGNATEKANGNEVSWVDFSNLTSKAAAEKGATVAFDLNTGTYNNLNLTVGVPSSLNKKIPSDFKSTNSLSEEGQYWDSWKSYIFTKTEGKIDTSNIASDAFNFSYHTGTDEMFRTVSLPKSFTIDKDKNTDITIELDVKELLDGKSGTVNPFKDQNAHSLSNKAVALKISDNYKTALKIK